MSNLAKAREVRPGMPRRTRTEAEAAVVDQLIRQWWHYAEIRGIPLGCSIRAMGRKLGCSYEHVRDVVKRHRAHPEELQRAVCRNRMVTMQDFEQEHARSEELRTGGGLRPRTRR
jgi:hypothetical protein